MNDLTFSAFSYLLDAPLNLREDQSSQRLFTTTLGKTEEIQIKFNSVKSSLRKGLDNENNLATDFLPVIEATQKLEQLIETYWIYFEEKDKNQLEVMANLIKQTNLQYNLYRNNSKILESFILAQLSLAETILDLRDLENPNDPDVGLKLKEDVKQQLIASKKQADEGKTGMSLEEVIQELGLDL
jgi:hypothetical protein